MLRRIILISIAIVPSITRAQLNHFSVTAQGGGSIPAETAGAPFFIQVIARDSVNNPVTSFSGTVQITSTGNLLAGGGTSESFVNGALNSHSVKFSNTGSFTITATNSSGPETGTSNAFTVGPGPAAIVQPELAADGSSGPVPPITVTSGTSVTFFSNTRDTLDNYISNVRASAWSLLNITGNVTASDLATAGGRRSAVFTGNLTGTCQIQATFTGLQAVLTGIVTVVPGPASSLAFIQQPSNVVSSAVITPAVTVGLRDAAGNSIHTAGVTVTMTVSGGGLSGTTSRVTDTSGVATFNDLSVGPSGSKTLTASSGGLTPATSNSFSVSAGPATQLVFVQGPTNAVAGATISPSVTVQIKDAAGNNVSAGNLPITVSLLGTGTLSGTLVRNTNGSGLAAFNNLSVNLTGIKQLKADRAGLTSDTSANFTITPGALNNFLVEAASGGAIGSQVASSPFVIRVTARDANTNTVTSFAGTVTVTSTGTLSKGGGTSPSFVNGVLASDTVAISNAGTFTITATRTGGAETGTSNSFPVSSGTLSNFLVEASSGGAIGTQAAGTPFTIRITARDAGNNTVAGFTGTVDITSTGNILSGGGTTPSFVNGVLSSQAVTMSNTGSFTLTATRTGGSETGTSNTFTVTAGAAKKIQVETAANGTGTIVPAQNVSPGSSITVFAISRDSLGNFVANSAADVWALKNVSGGVLPTDLVASADKKSAVFTGHATGSAVIEADLGALSPVTSGTITVVVGAPVRLAFVQEPGAVTSGTIISPAVTVQVEDLGGNAVAAPGISVTVTLSGTGALSGTVTQTTNSTGLATFNDLRIDLSGSKKLIATSSPLAPDTSAAFTVSAGPLNNFLVESAAGGPIPAQTSGVAFAIRITARDANTNTVTSFTGTADISSTGTLSQGSGTTANFTAGVLASDTVAFRDGGSFTITATASRGGQSGTSNIFSVINPAPVTTGISPSVKTAGDNGFTLTVSGSGFIASSVVRVNGADRATIFGSSSQLTASILSSDIAAPGTLTITVFTATPGGGTSNPQSLSVVNVGLNARIFLQGPFLSGAMSTTLAGGGFIPLAQPYNTSPWNYAGTEQVGTIPANTVDWILVELRTGTASSTKIAARAGFLKSDGTIVDTDGTSLLGFSGISSGSYYIVVRHRNHVAVMSSNPVALTGTSVLYDFTTGQTQAFGSSAMASLSAGVFGLYAGDVTANGVLKYSGSGNDSGPIYARIGGGSVSATVTGYFGEDTNMNGIVKYSGAQNDRAIIYANIGGGSVSSTLSGQVPP